MLVVVSGYDDPQFRVGILGPFPGLGADALCLFPCGVKVAARLVGRVKEYSDLAVTRRGSDDAGFYYAPPVACGNAYSR